MLVFVLISTSRKEKYTFEHRCENAAISSRRKHDQLKDKNSLSREIERKNTSYFQEVKNECKRRSRAEGLCNGSRVRHRRKNS